jgi:hypothetical protein
LVFFVAWGRDETMQISVFCCKPLNAFTDSALEFELSTGDLWSAAERNGLHERAADDAIPHLRVSEGAIYWRAPEHPPVLFEFSQEPEEIRMRRDEALSEIQTLEPSKRSAIAERLEGVVAIATIELRFSQVCDPDMGFVLAYELAHHLARETDGLIWATDRTWWVWPGNRLTQIA